MAPNQIYHILVPLFNTFEARNRACQKLRGSAKTRRLRRQNLGWGTHSTTWKILMKGWFELQRSCVELDRALIKKNETIILEHPGSSRLRPGSNFCTRSSLEDCCGYTLFSSSFSMPTHFMADCVDSWDHHIEPGRLQCRPHTVRDTLPGKSYPAPALATVAGCCTGHTTTGHLGAPVE